MGRENHGMGRAVSRLFRERQIYHRSEGIVRFIKLTPRNQIVMAGILGATLLWVAYSSVNVVFKEQIIVSKEQERRDQEAAYRRRLQTAETAYDQVNALNYIYAREFDARISELNRQHDTLRALVENKSLADRRYNELADALAQSGAPNGKSTGSSTRIMIDPVGREPTPRQSRISALRESALRSVMEQRVAEGIDDDVLADMRRETAELSARQVVAMAVLEQDMRRHIRETARILNHTGVDIAPLVAQLREANAFTTDAGGDYTGQGGPYIPPNGDAASAAYFKSAARIGNTFDQMVSMRETLQSVPLAGPVNARHRMTSRFGYRWDPIKRNVRAPHKGLDFAAPRNTPIVATATGKVAFAGVRGGFGRVVEIDHGNGFKTRYAHLNRISVRAGQKVKLHEKIGLMGSTGRSTGNHVHYEIHFGGRQVDPLRFIEAGRYVFES